MTPLTCGRCGAARDRTDNFCRRCGQQLTASSATVSRPLPAVRPSALPTRGRALPPSLVGSVAVLVLGTGLEWLARRLAGAAGRAAGRALSAERRLPAKRSSAAPADLSVDEVIYVRKVQLRR